MCAGSGYTLRIVHSMQQAELSEAKQSERGQRESLHHMTDLEREKAQTGAREKRRPKDQRNLSFIVCSSHSFSLEMRRGVPGTAD